MKIEIIKIFVFLILTFQGYSELEAQPVKPDQRVLNPVNISQIDIESYRQNKDFDYTLQEHSDNILIKMLNWIKRKIKAFLYRFFSWILGVKNAGKWVYILMQSLPYLAVFIFVYLIYRFLIGTDLIASAKNKKRFDGQVYTSTDEQIIKEADLDQLIKEAVQKQNYRLAIRYYYLKLLKYLIDNQLIEWHPDKTNRDYVMALKGSELQPLFNRLTYIYEYVWYGKFKPDVQDFETMQHSFQKFSL